MATFPKILHEDEAGDNDVCFIYCLEGSEIELDSVEELELARTGWREKTKNAAWEKIDAIAEPGNAAVLRGRVAKGGPMTNPWYMRFKVRNTHSDDSKIVVPIQKCVLATMLQKLRKHPDYRNSDLHTMLPEDCKSFQRPIMPAQHNLVAEPKAKRPISLVSKKTKKEDKKDDEPPPKSVQKQTSLLQKSGPSSVFFKKPEESGKKKASAVIEEEEEAVPDPPKKKSKTTTDGASSSNTPLPPPAPASKSSKKETATSKETSNGNPLKMTETGVDIERRDDFAHLATIAEAMDFEGPWHVHLTVKKK